MTMGPWWQWRRVAKEEWEGPNVDNETVLPRDNKS